MKPFEFVDSTDGKEGSDCAHSQVPVEEEVRRDSLKRWTPHYTNGTRAFYRIPLLMTIMLLTYGDTGKVPSKMHLFYE